MNEPVSSDRKNSLLPTGQVVAGRFRITGVVGEGAQGIVYKAVRSPEADTVALKVIHRRLLGDPQIFKRFHREAAILKRLEGEHLGTFVDFIEHEGLLVIALEHVEGRSLEDILAQGAPIALKDAVEIALQICAALGVAHAAGVVHRDLKPANVLVERFGEVGYSPCARVVDFGLAKVVHGEQMTTGLTEQDMIFGTPEYMAPEQVRGEDADPRSDLYAAGCMLYEMAVGRVPFSEKSPLATMTAQLTQEPRAPRSSNPDRGISPALEAVIQRAMAKELPKRYATARDFAEALAAARDQTVVVALQRGDDAEAISTTDTDLSVSTSGLDHARTIPGDAPRSRAGIEPAIPSRRRRRDRMLWAIVAIVAAVVGIAIGTLAGAR